MAITPLPAAPSRQSPSDFSVKADAFIAALPTFITEANAQAAALELNSTTSNSTTSLAIGTGAKSLTVDVSKSYQPGMSVKIARTAAPSNWMHGDVTSYNSGTGALVVNVLDILGSGTYTDWTITFSAPSPAYAVSRIFSVGASVDSNALTLTLAACVLDFRSATLTTGAPNARSVASALSLVVPSGATLGTVDAVAARLAVLAIDNAGTVELAVVNLAGGNNLDETTLITTTTIGTAADAANVSYSTTGRAGVPFRVVGFIDITEATAGAWATAPAIVQGAGGQAMAALQSLGYGQTWQAVTRTSGTTYYNTTGRPITLQQQNVGNASNVCSSTITINGGAPITFIVVGANSYGAYGAGEIVIPAGASYVVTDAYVNAKSVFELR